MSTITFMCSMAIMSYSSTMMIICILSVTIIGASLLMMFFASKWMSFLILFIIVGGLMILYIFVLSINSNESNKKMNFKFFFIPLLVLLYSKMSSQTNMKNESTKIVYENFIQLFLMMMTIVLIIMAISSKIMMNPFTPSKSFK